MISIFFVIRSFDSSWRYYFHLGNSWYLLRIDPLVGVFVFFVFALAGTDYAVLFVDLVLFFVIVGLIVYTFYVGYSTVSTLLWLLAKSSPHSCVLSQYIHYVCGSSDIGGRLPLMSLYCYHVNNMLRLLVDHQKPRRQVGTTVSTLDLYLLPGLVGESLPCHLMFVRCFQLGTQWVAGDSEHTKHISDFSISPPWRTTQRECQTLPATRLGPLMRLWHHMHRKRWLSIAPPLAIRRALPLSLVTNNMQWHTTTFSTTLKILVGSGSLWATRCHSLFIVCQCNYIWYVSTLKFISGQNI